MIENDHPGRLGAGHFNPRGVNRAAGLALKALDLDPRL